MINPRKPDYSNTPASETRPAFSYRPAAPSAAPAVTVVTAFFNPGKVFRETATSILRQSLQQWEWVIVDDCSSDPESLRILESYQQADPRIRVVRTASRSGPAAARNLGVRMAGAPFIAFVDSDDLFEPTALEKLRWFLECNPQYAFARGYSVGFGAKNYLWTEGFHNGSKILETNPISITGMLRREVYLEVGGMDAEIRGGLEDWDFWLKCADQGYWGGTLREYLDWYRRREDHRDRWEDWDGAEKQETFRESLSQKYPDLWRNGVPQLDPSYDLPYPVLTTALPFANTLGRREGVKRLLMIVPHLELGGADKFNLDLIRCLQESHGYEVTVVATIAGGHPWRHCFEQLTPDVFTLSTFLPLAEYFRFIAYLIQSRSPEVVLITNSQMGYQLAPSLRAQCPGPAFVDYIHMEEDHWKNGNYPRYSLNYSAFLDRTIVSSQHLKQWMVDRSGSPSRIQVCTTNIDPDEWNRSNHRSARLRAKYGVPEGLPVISFAGRLCDQKQPDVVAAVVKALRDRGAKFVCLVAGDGEHRAKLEEFVRSSALDNELRLLGARPNDEVREILAISDIYFMPSRMEGIALTLFEAMAMEVVPVCADVGGQAELVTPDCGILIQHDVNEMLAYTEALVRLLGHQRDRAAMAAACRKRVCEYFTLRQMGERMVTLLEAARHEELDLLGAFVALRSTLATEVIEQTRCEKVAGDLWQQRAALVHVSPIEAVPAPVAAELSVSQAGPTPAGALAPEALPAPAPRNASFSGVFSTVLMLASPRHFWSKWKNLNLLRKVLADDAARSRLERAFNPGFYISHHEDLRHRRVMPLLHYAIQGYLENRQPSPEFNAVEVLNQNPALAGVNVNPLLWSVLHSKG